MMDKHVQRQTQRSSESLQNKAAWSHKDHVRQIEGTHLSGI